MTFREILAALTTTPRSGCPTIPTRPAPPLAPDWACEVLSPSTRKLDLHGKRPIYAREGSSTCGWWTRRTGRWRRWSCAKASAPSTPSPSISAASGPEAGAMAGRGCLRPRSRTPGIGIRAGVVKCERMVVVRFRELGLRPTTSRRISRASSSTERHRNRAFLLRKQAARGGAPGWIRTSDPRFRRPMLYPAELRAHLRSLAAHRDPARFRTSHRR